jgi:hypothetical protein
LGEGAGAHGELLLLGLAAVAGEVTDFPQLKHRNTMVGVCCGGLTGDSCGCRGRSTIVLLLLAVATVVAGTVVAGIAGNCLNTTV